MTGNQAIKEQILQKIREYDTVLLFRHQRMDGDCVGAVKGLQRILQLSFPEKKVLLHDWQRSNYLAFMGPDDEDVPEEMHK
ncbi:MAG: bifunctional oligoribonuclease/PAP phosphatase NrnA, partial [Clostridia bacterium]|nr:bifunctional oligoribonuclease/PAP phosphatase NrnA [Clostridia bacterium]